MPYNHNLDECLFSKSWETEAVRLTVSVHSYNKGRNKLQISRQNINTEGEFRIVRLGRITKEEIEAILPLMQEALNHMD